jgi:predicted ATPase/DNA-binding SARP family transcriptional activator
VAENGRVLPLGRGRQRALLGLLLLRANEVVTQDLLVDALWGESPPPTANTALHGYVSRLRKLLGSERIETRPSGYALRVAADELDLHRFERLIGQERYADALALWRGPPLADLAFESFAQADIVRLEELRLAAREGQFERELGDGRHADLVGQLTAAIREDPLRERFTAQLMLALYRAGRQADALTAYQEARTRLVEQLGLEPGVELRTLQRRILQHDPGLHVPARHRTTLPASTSSFVGRLRELEHLRGLLQPRGARLLTLTGAGGSGKTRLALEVARRLENDFADGACFVPLAAVGDPELVAAAIAQSLELRPSLGQSITEALRAYVRERDLLLVVDNFEHLLDAAPLVSELLTAAPELTVLATSRTHLNLYGESEYAVPPLALPEPRAGLEDIAHVESIALFVERARAVQTNFELTTTNAEAIAGICARLDGLPLAIELAAARIRTLSPTEILARLEQRLELLTDGPRDVHARQRTLRDTLRWSYDLLPPDHQRLFARLGVFAGGWSAAAADHVCWLDASDGLASLAEQSLIQVEEERFTMLETIRELSVEQLAATGEEHEIRSRHANWFLAVAEEGGPSRRGVAREAWFERMGRERENLRAAVAWGAREQGGNETALRIAAALQPFWTSHGLLGEGRRSLDLLLASAREQTVGRARALAAAGWFAGLQADLDTCESLCRQSLSLLPPGEEWYRAICLNLLGTMARYRGNLTEAWLLYDEALTLSEERDLWFPTALVLANRGYLYEIEGRHREEAESHERAVAVALAGGDRWMAAMCLTSVGRAARHSGDLQRAVARHHDALRAFVQLENAWGVANCLAGLAGVAADRGDLLRAARLYGAEHGLRLRAGVSTWQTIRSEHDADVQAVSTALGEAEWERVHSQGTALTDEEAIAEALAFAVRGR